MYKERVRKYLVGLDKHKAAGASQTITKTLPLSLALPCLQAEEALCVTLYLLQSLVCHQADYVMVPLGSKKSGCLKKEGVYFQSPHKLELNWDSVLFSMSLVGQAWKAHLGNRPLTAHLLNACPIGIVEKLQNSVSLLPLQMMIIYKNHKYQTYIVLNKKLCSGDL